MPMFSEDAKCEGLRVPTISPEISVPALAHALVLPQYGS